MKKPETYLLFTADASYVVTGNPPLQPGKTARIAISRAMAALLKREMRAEKRKP